MGFRSLNQVQVRHIAYANFRTDATYDLVHLLAPGPENVKAVPVGPALARQCESGYCQPAVSSIFFFSFCFTRTQNKKGEKKHATFSSKKATKTIQHSKTS